MPRSSRLCNVNEQIYTVLENVQVPFEIGSFEDVQSSKHINSLDVAWRNDAMVPIENGISSDESNDGNSPYLKITIQPTDTFRFRYGSEKGSHGAIKGETSEGESPRPKKCYPTVKLENISLQSGRDIVIKVSLYTNENDPEPHIYELVGNKGLDTTLRPGECYAKLDKNCTATFPSLAIRTRKREDVIDILKERKIESYQSRNLPYDEDKLKTEVLDELKCYNLDSTKLCFEAFYKDNLSVPLCDKVFSTSVSNQKSTVAGELKISYLSSDCGKWSGEDEIVLLCDKIKKEDIKIRFFDKDSEWEDFGKFSVADVHYQVAIVFKTPKYHSNINATVCVELFRPTDEKSSAPCQFRYMADETVVSNKSRKRKRTEREEIIPEEMFKAFTQVPSSLPLEMDPSESFVSSSLPLEMDPSESFVSSSLPLEMDPSESFVSSSLLQKMDPSENFVSSSLPQEVASSECFLYSKNVLGDKFDLLSYIMDNDMDCILGGGSSDSNSNEEYKFESNCDTLNLMECKFSNPRNIFDDDQQYVKADGPVQKCSDFLRGMKSLTLNEKTEDLGTRTISKTLSYKSKPKSEDFIDSISKILKSRKISHVHYGPNLMKMEDENGNSLLHLAILEQNDDLNFIVKLLEMFSDETVNKQNKFKETALHLAVKGNHLKILLLLLMKGGNPNILNESGNNCLHLASEQNSIECLKLLMTPTRFEKARKCIKDIDLLNYAGLSPLHLAIINNAKACMNFLLDSKANVNMHETKRGRSPLHLAIDQPSLLLDILKHPEINIDAEDFRGYTAFHLACLKKGESYKDLSDEIGDDKEKIIEFFKSLHDDPSSSSVTNYQSTDSDSQSDDFAGEKASITKEIFDNKSNLLNIEKEFIKFLDLNENWKKLGELIGMDVDFVAKFDEGSSPGQTVIKQYKMQDCDFTMLAEILESVGLSEGAKILQRN